MAIPVFRYYLALTFVLVANLAVDRFQAPAFFGTGVAPVNDLGPRSYLGQFQGGLYGHSSNQMPPAHFLAGLAHGAAIQPLDALGRPDPAGKDILLSAGMSNTTQKFWGANQRGPAASWSFAGQATSNPTVRNPGSGHLAETS